MKTELQMFQEDMMTRLATDNIVTDKVFWRLTISKVDDGKIRFTKDIPHHEEDDSPAILLIICSQAFYQFLRTAWQTLPGRRVVERKRIVPWKYNQHHNLFSLEWDGYFAIVKWTETKRTVTTWR